MDQFFRNKLNNTKRIELFYHEIKTPLVNIKSFLETLYEYHFYLTDIQVFEFLEIATQETNRLVRLANQNLQVAKLNSRVIMLVQLCAIDNILNRVARSYEITGLIKKIQLYYKSQKKIDRVLGNPDLIFQVLINLITNSIKFTYPNGIVILKVKNLTSLNIKNRAKFNFVRIDIIDTGVGFNTFRNASILNSRKSVKSPLYFLEGNGIGLPIIKDILNMHKTSHKLVSKICKGTHTFFNL